TLTSMSLITCSSFEWPRWNHLLMPSARTISSDMAVEPTFEKRSGGREHEHEGDVEERNGRVELERCAVEAVELVRRAHQVGGADDRDDRRVLDDVDELIGERWQGDPERLREDDRAEGPREAEPEAEGRLPLT